MNKYLELKMKQSKEFRKLPMKVAFGKKQFEEIMKQWGFTTSKEDTTKVCMLVSGCYCLIEDKPLFDEYFERTEKEITDFLKDDDNLKIALKYEFANHECGYTDKPQDALPPLFITLVDLKTDERMKRMFNEAWTEFLNEDVM